MESRIARAIVLVVSVLVIGIVLAVATLVLVAPDVVPTFDSNSRGINRLWEDGSFIISPLDKFSITGCLPLHPWNGDLVTGWCLDGGSSVLGYFDRGVWVWAIGVDSPWEDFAPRPIADFMYWFLGSFIK